jgi:hypothetical protein
VHRWPIMSWPVRWRRNGVAMATLRPSVPRIPALKRVTVQCSIHTPVWRPRLLTRKRPSSRPDAKRRRHKPSSLIHTLIQLGKALNLETLAEGIEEDGQLAQLRREDCDVGQGYLFARPVGPEEIEKHLLSSAAPVSA